MYIYIPHEPQLLELCSPTSLGKPPCRTFIKFITSHLLLQGASKCPLFLRQETRSRSDHCHSSRLQALPKPPEPPVPPDAIRISGANLPENRFGWATWLMKIIENPMAWWKFPPDVSFQPASCDLHRLHLAQNSTWHWYTPDISDISDISDMAWKVNR